LAGTIADQLNHVLVEVVSAEEVRQSVLCSVVVGRVVIHTITIARFGLERKGVNRPIRYGKPSTLLNKANRQ